jgi:hypothetical protein
MLAMSANTLSHRAVPPSRRRDKAIVSCTLCRRRKLKCDRQQPCKTCVDRGLSHSCTFSRTVPTPQEPRAASSVHSRIDQLERLVTDLMAGNTEHPSPTLPTNSQLQYQCEEDAELPGTPDRVNISSDSSISYTNSSHWTSILDGVSHGRMARIDPSNSYTDL